MTQKLRFGLVGCGDFGKELGRYLLEVADITALCDLDQSRAEHSARQLQLNVPCYSRYQEMFAPTARLRITAA
jgi:predicted dehydrogenase